jgi:hypothetical protein
MSSIVLGRLQVKTRTDEFWIPVKVLGSKRSYGRAMLLVQPLDDGTKERWVYKNKVKLEKPDAV